MTNFQLMYTSVAMNKRQLNLPGCVFLENLTPARTIRRAPKRPAQPQRQLDLDQHGDLPATQRIPHQPRRIAVHLANGVQSGLVMYNI